MTTLLIIIWELSQYLVEESAAPPIGLGKYHKEQVYLIVKL